MPQGGVRRPEVTLKRQVLEVDSGCFWGHLESGAGGVHWLFGRLSGELLHFRLPQRNSRFCTAGTLELAFWPVTR